MSNISRSCAFQKLQLESCEPAYAQVHFAGEATCHDLAGYTTGAFLSGILAGHDILSARNTTHGSSGHQWNLANNALVTAAKATCRLPSCNAIKAP